MIQNISDHIIVVDDDDVFADVIALRLQDAGFENIAVFTNPREALKSIRDNTRPAIVITDFIMPGLNGVELLNEIDRHHPKINGVVVTCNISTAVESPHRYPVIDKLTKIFYRELIAHTLNIIRSNVRPLLDACPAGTEKPECPFKNIRVKDSEKAEWLEALRPKDIRPLVQHHLSCMNICAE